MYPDQLQENVNVTRKKVYICTFPARATVVSHVAAAVAECPSQSLAWPMRAGPSPGSIVFFLLHAKSKLLLQITTS